jgi:putative toxin-antitoxin system antitoxin component (TIGR02293 family)
MKYSISKQKEKDTALAEQHPSAYAVSDKGDGAVNYFLHEASGATNYTSSQMIQSVQRGLPMDELNVLQASLDIPLDRLALKLGMSRATLHRRKHEGRLAREESDHVLRFARLMGRAISVFEGEQAARQWLQAPQFGLGGAVPLDYAETEIGAREVEDLLGRIEYGVYS